MDAKPGGKSAEKDVMIDCIKSRGKVEKTETRYLFGADRIYKMIMNIGKCGFSGVVFTIGRLMGV